MATLTFETLASANRLKATGIPDKQAEAFAEELRVASDIDTSGLATKADLATLETNMIKYMFTGFVTMAGLLTAILFKLH